MESLIRAEPKRALWWIAQEAKFKNDPRITGNGGVFRVDRPSYARMHKAALDQDEMHPYDDDDGLQDCACTE